MPAPVIQPVAIARHPAYTRSSAVITQHNGLELARLDTSCLVVRQVRRMLACSVSLLCWHCPVQQMGQSLNRDAFNKSSCWSGCHRGARTPVMVRLQDYIRMELNTFFSPVWNFIPTILHVNAFNDNLFLQRLSQWLSYMHNFCRNLSP